MRHHSPPDLRLDLRCDSTLTYTRPLWSLLDAYDSHLRSFRVLVARALHRQLPLDRRWGVQLQLPASLDCRLARVRVWSRCACALVGRSEVPGRGMEPGRGSCGVGVWTIRLDTRRSASHPAFTSIHA